jgi:alginate O-acetyltransferase complex protein AlgI
MTFLSYRFILFFLAAAAVYFAAPRKLKPGVLLAASLIFYGSLQLGFLALLAAEALAAYGFGLWLEKRERRGRRAAFIVSLAVLLGPLLVFKYSDFFIQAVASAVRGLTHGRPWEALGLALPAGISFYTFKSLSYVIDVYRGRTAAEKNPVLVGLYISFFPQIFAGPIERAGNFFAPFRGDYHFDLGRAAGGVRLVLWGLFKKIVVADRLAQYVNIVFDKPQDYAGLSLLIGLVFYSFQIYCDFSGYSDMAIGLARMLGLETMDNFNFPYFSRSITEFWSRWHISLSSWLRDYLFLPISYRLSRKIKAERFLLMKTDFFLYLGGMSVTMLLCGLWHGANWTFIVWGAVHGVYLVSSRATHTLRMRFARRFRLRRSGGVWNLFRTVFVFCLVSLAWVFFRSPSLASAWNYLGSVSFKLPRRGVGVLLFLASLLVVFILSEWLIKNRKALWGERRIPAPVQAVAYALFLCLIIILAADTSNEFLYFQF